MNLKHVFLGCIGLAALLACGGGSSGVGETPLPAPHITSFTGRPSMILSGSSSTLNALFEQGAGSLDHGLGSLTSGVDVGTGPLTNTTTYSVTTAVTLYAYVHGCPGYLDSSVGSAAYTITSSLDSGASGNVKFEGNSGIN